jgi:hypothetical protein
MSVDFAALAMAVVSGVPDVRACLVVSRDGLALGAYPASEEEKALKVWSRMATLGEVERGFVALRDGVWAFSRRGPYAALVTGHPSARVGVLLDGLDQMLLAAEEARVRKDAIRPAQEREAAAPDALRGPRTPLHPVSREEADQPGSAETSPRVALEQSGVSAWVKRLRAQASQAMASSTVTEEPSSVTDEPAEATEESSPQPDPDAAWDRPDPQESPAAHPPSDAERPRGSGWEVDRAALNREFAGLLSEGQDDEGER